MSLLTLGALAVFAAGAAAQTSTRTSTRTPTSSHTPTETRTPTLTATLAPSPTPSQTPTTTGTGTPTPIPTCGDNQVAEGEICDDGNRFGGDGCSANCTLETTRVFVISPELSEFRLQTLNADVEADSALLAAAMTLVTGAPAPDGRIAVAIPAGGVEFAPIQTASACTCIRALPIADRFGPGNAGAGFIGCGNGLAQVSFLLQQDHDTEDVDPDCQQANPLTLDSACRETTAAEPLCNPRSPHDDVCNGPLVVEPLAGGPPGSAFFEIALSFSVLTATTAGCAPHPGDPAYGLDGLACTNDDPGQRLVRIVPVSTGQISSRVIDANNLPGEFIGPGETCGIAACQTTIDGAPFDCAALLTPEGGLEGAALALSLPIIDGVPTGDVVASYWLNTLGGPTVTPQPTRTFTPTRTATIFRSPSATRTGTETKVPTRTRTPTLTRTPQNTPTSTRTLTPSWTVRPSASRTATKTALPIASPTGPTQTITSTRTVTPTQPTATPSQTRTITLTASPTNTRIFTRTATATRTITLTRTRTATFTPEPEETVSPALTTTPTNTGTPTPTGPTGTPTATATGPTVTSTATAAPATSTATPSATATLAASATATHTPSATAVASATRTQTAATPLETSTSSRTPTPTATPTLPGGTPPSATVTPPVTPTASASPATTAIDTATPTSPPSTPSATPTGPRRGDLNGDGLVNEVDLRLLIRNLFAPNPIVAADVNGDGRVNAADLIAIADAV